MGIISIGALLVCAVVAGWRQGVAERTASAPPAPGVASGGDSVIHRALPLASKPELEFPPPPPEPAAEAKPPAQPIDRVLPHEQPLQRIAFTRYRLAWLQGEQLSVRRLSDLQEVARVAAHGAQNVVALVGGGFLSLARDRIQRLSGVDTRAERLPRAPRIGPTTLLPSSQNAEQFWLYYEGVPQLPLFDLASEPIVDSSIGLGPALPALEFVELADFDRRALLHFGDGSMIYTTADGLARIDAIVGSRETIDAGVGSQRTIVEQRRERLPLPEIAGAVWRLARSVRRDQVWAATAHHLYRIDARAPASILERIELPPHPLALASAGRELALLSIETVSEQSAALRVDVYTSRASGIEHRRVLRFDDYPPRGRADAGAATPFLPEVALSPDGALLAAAGFGLFIFDWGAGRQLYPTQNLAPTAP